MGVSAKVWVRAEGEGEGGGEGDAPPAKRAAKGPFFESRPTIKVAWSCAGSGSEGFLGFCNITSAKTFNARMWNEAKWVGDLLGSGDASYNQGLEDGKVANFGNALRVMAEGPWEVGGETFQNKKMWIARVLWPELRVEANWDKLPASDQYDADKASRQLKKVECGIDMVVEAYNLHQDQVMRCPDFTPIARTDKEVQMRLRDGKAMDIITAILAKGKQLVGTDGAQAMISGMPTPVSAAPAQAEEDVAMADAAADLEALQQPVAAEPTPTEPTRFAKGDKVHFSFEVLTGTVNHEGTVVEDDGVEAVLVRAKTAGDREMKVGRGTVGVGWPSENADA